MSDPRPSQSTSPAADRLRRSLDAFPITLLTAGLVATLVFLTLISLGTTRAYRALEQVSTHELRIQGLIGRIAHLDEALTMSARMAASTGDLRWERRYREFEPQLDAVLLEMERLASGSYAAFAEETRSANSELVAMESQAFALVRDGRREDAAGVLFGPDYEASKGRYAEGMDALRLAVEEHIQRERESHGREVSRVWTLAGVSALLLLLAWLAVFGLIRRRVAERRRAEEDQQRLVTRMQHTQKSESLGVLAGGIAHDFNNLLTVILGNSRVALSELGPDSRLREPLRRIRTAAEYAAELVDQILTYSGRPSVDLKPIDLSRLVEEMRTLLQASATGRCELALSCEAELPAIEADATQIRQVVLNLVTNASEAGEDDDASVSVRTGVTYRSAAALRDAIGAADQSGEYVLLEVTDRGTGMDAETQARIFEPFFSGKGFGRGLGLASVLGIVRVHRGALEVESEPGRGTSIRALFPLSARRAEERPMRPAEAPDERRGRVLLIDDEEWVLEVAKAFLEKAGFEVTTAIGGRRGLERFEAQVDRFHAVVVDLAMPDVPGHEVLERIRALRPSLPVVAVSGYNQEVATERFGRLEFEGFLHKPYEPEDLVRLLRSLVGRPGHSSR